MIISDLSAINSHHKNNNVNKNIQNFCVENMLCDPDINAAKQTLVIMITLYKKKVWNDSKTVNALAKACELKDLRLVNAACKFFLGNYEEAIEDSDEEEQIAGYQESLKKLMRPNSRKKKQDRKELKKRLMKAIERRQKRRSKVSTNKDFMPIDLINDPTHFSEKLFGKLKTIKSDIDKKLTLMKLIGRVMGRHKIYINHFFNYLLNYLRPGQKNLEIIFGAVIEACHDLIPPTDLEPIMEKLFDNFISETHPAEYICQGLDTALRIIERCPYVINKEYINVIETLKTYKNKSVRNAARALINCLKEINSNLLGIYDNDADKEIFFGQAKVSDSIDGIELLKKHDNLPKDYRMEYEEILDDKQLKKLKILRMKYNAEKIQNRKINLSKNEIDGMAGVDEEKEKENNENDSEDDYEEIESKEGEEMEDLEDLEDLEELENLSEELDGEGSEIEFEEGKPHPKIPDLSLNEPGEDDDLSISQISSDELKSNKSDEESEENNEFVEGDFFTYKKRFNEKKETLKNEEKEKYIRRKREKMGGKTNKEKLKNKPLMMVMPKKRKTTQQNKIESLNKSIKNLKKQQLGRFKRGNMVLKKKNGVSRKK